MSANAGEISIDLRLTLEKLRGDIAAASKAMKEGLAANFTNASSDVDKTTDSMKRLASGVRSVTRAIKAQAEAWNQWKQLNLGSFQPSTQSFNVGGVPLTVPPASVTPAVPAVKPPPIPKQPKPEEQKGYDLALMVRTGLFSSGMPGSYIFSRMVNSPLAAPAAAIAAAILGLRKVIEELSSAFQHSASLYAKVLQSGGMASGFVIRQSHMAGVMGVGENDVLRFGAAMAKIAPQIRYANEVFQRVTPELTATTWKFRSMMLNLKASFAELAVQLAPSVNAVLTVINKVISLGGAGKAITTAIKMVPGMDVMLKIIETINKYLPKDKAPGVPADPNRYPASPWERMGLVLGNMGTSDHARQTAHNTKISAEYLARIAAKISVSNAIVASPQFNMP